MRKAETKRIILTILNPQPGQDGSIHASISVYHAQRHMGRLRAYRADADWTPNTEGSYLVFCERSADVLDTAERILIGAMHGHPSLPAVVYAVWQACWLNTKASVLRFWPDQRSSAG